MARQAIVPTRATGLFTLLAKPHRHHEIDGSDTVQERVKGPTALMQGDRFSVAMKQYGVPYTISSRVTAYQQDRVLEWRHPAGHKSPWELSSLGPISPQVTETWDATTSAAYLIFT